MPRSSPRRPEKKYKDSSARVFLPNNLFNRTPTSLSVHRLPSVFKMANAVTQLNNYFQGKGAPHAVSWVEHSTGPSHAVKWTVQCKVSGEVIGTGTADTKAAAKEEAAKEALAALGV
ncbi:hypothetical protein R3P38DRAFT_2820763 [Favolaschia claudopus]|uniref:DRBM domain-containing protein n=1 Tax=Favolaschia claudopus TaxID=2862362 RepID=A0AAW0EHK3_9AGAR